MQIEIIQACVVDGTSRLPGDLVDTSEETGTAVIKDGFAKAAGGAQVAAPATAAAPAVGDACTTTEGAAGTIQDNGNGSLVCVATEAPAPAAEAATPRVIAQADLDANPILVELAAAVGDTVAVTKAA